MPSTPLSKLGSCLLEVALRRFYPKSFGASKILLTSLLQKTPLWLVVSGLIVVAVAVVQVVSPTFVAPQTVAASARSSQFVACP